MYEAQLTLHDKKIRIKSNHSDYLHDMKEHFSIHVKNYFFMSRYKAGFWNGKINFISNTGLISYGLLFDFLRISKKLFPNVKIKADEGVKNLFKGPELDINYNLKYKPRYYQKESVEICLKRKKGIIVSATASGKSLSISYIIKTLLENKKTTRVNRALIIVPTVDLVNQFKDDMISYGIKEKIGIVYSKKKEFDNPIVVSTWQTMKNQIDKLALYQAIIVDEVHKGKALQLKKILSKSNASYRFGFTGTMPDNTVDEYNVKSYLGSILKEYSSGLLAEQEYISKCTVKVINVTYPDIESNTYHQIIGEVFNKEKRLNIIENITNSIGDENILFLVSKIAEGEKLEKLVNRRCKKKKVIFLSGKDKAEIREEWRKKMIKEKNIVVIATFQIFQEGLNIPNLKYALLASSSQSKIRILQSLGRTLRLHKSKKEGAFIFDIVDDVKYLKKHGEKRMSFYEEEGHTIEFIKEEEFKI